MSLDQDESSIPATNKRSLVLKCNERSFEVLYCLKWNRMEAFLLLREAYWERVGAFFRQVFDVSRLQYGQSVARTKS